MKKRMTVLAMVMTLVLCLLALPAVAGADTTVPEGYPAIIQGLDFGGATVYIYDWWSSGTRSENPSETEALQYAYWDWLEATYNVHVVETAGTEWGTAYDDLATQVRNQDASVLCIRAIPADYAGKAMKNNLFASWTYGLDSGNFNQGTVQFMTRGNTCYGVTYRAASEPRQGVFFNKTILGEETVSAIYAAQAAGTWTWEMMEEYMEAVQQDTDNDGTIDIWGLTGNGDDITISLVISNGVDFYAFDENGKLVPSIDTPAMRAALAKRKNWGTYLCPSEGWNGYETNWNNGNCAFMIAKAYNGFSSTGFVATSGYDWGFVALPKGPEADRYVTQTSNNVYGIPNVYDLTTTLNLEQIFTLWTRPVPGTEDDAWATSLAEITNDADAIATYGMLRQGDHGVAMTYNLIGSEMETLSEILWAIGSGTVDEVIDNALDAFQQRCDAYNGDLPWSIDGNGVLTISGVGAMTSHPWTNDPATAASIQNVVIAEGVTTICENAFEGCTNMTEIHIPNSMLRIGGAFADCTSLTDVYYNGVETDWGYMRYMFPAGGNDLSGWNRLVYAECLHFAATEEADPAVIDVQVFEEGNTVPLEAEGDEENIYTTLCNANVNIVFSAPEIEGYTTTFRFSPAGGSWYDGPLVPENDGAYTYSRGRIPASDTGALYGIVLVYIPNDFSNPFLVSETKWIRIRGTSNGTATMELSAPNYYIKGSGSNGYTFSIDFPEEMIEHMTAWNVSVYSPVDYSTVFSDYETLPTTNHVSYTIPADQLEIGKKYEISINPAFAGYTSRILYKNFTVLDAAGEDISITLTDEEGNIPETLYTGTI